MHSKSNGVFQSFEIFRTFYRICAEPIGIQSEEAGRICFLEKEEIRRARYHFSQGG